MKLITLPAMTREQLGFTHKVIITHEDVAALGSGTSGVIPIFPSSGEAPAGTTVRDAAIRITKPWDASDDDLNSILIEVGDGGDTDRFLTQTQVAEDGTEVESKITAATTLPHTYTAADTIDVKVTVSGGASPTCAEVNAGECEIYLRIDFLDDLGRPR